MSLRGILYFLLICLFVQTSWAEKSLFSVDSHHGPITRAYSIEGTTLTDPVTISEELYGAGPTGVAISEELGLMFMCYESDDTVTVFRCRSLLKVSDVDTNVYNLAGIVADDDKDKIYILQRNTFNLYVYTWNDITETLDSESQEELYDLPSPYTGTGIALDGEYLYVTDTSDTVQCYDTTNWDHQSDMDITLPQENDAWGIAVYHDLLDNRYGYFGGYVSGSHNNLIRVDLDDPNDYLIVMPSPDSPVLGLAVDLNTGLVYASVADHTNRVFDTSLNELFSIDTNVTGSGPAGMAVGNRYYVPFKIEKSDDLGDNNCVSPQMSEITYTICYDYMWDDNDPDPCNFDSLSVIDYLPEEVDFVSASDGGRYDPNHFVIWDINVETFDPNCVELVVKVNKKVVPGGEIENTSEIVAVLTIDDKELEYIDRHTVTTLVCDCYNFGQIIHVDKDVNVADPNGSSWATAYKDLQDALDVSWPCDEIWVAEANDPYKPTDDPCDTDATFKLPNSIWVYGGFEGADSSTYPGGETHHYQRNWYENKTILSGDINDNDNSDDPNSYNDNLFYVVVDANSVINILDGFVIEGGTRANIYCNNSSSVIQHNRISNGKFGIYCQDTNQSIILNNWIYRNQYGIYLDNTSGTIVQNNTIANNSKAGIYRDGGTDPDISNCILWDNLPGKDIVDCNAVYSLITDGDIGTGNLDGDPNHPPFDDIDDNDYHIDPDSDPNGIDAGNPDGDYAGQRDIDEQFRVLDGNDDGTKRIDMGADEYCNEGDSNVADIDNDGIVNYLDFSILAAAWLDVPGIPSADIAPPEGDNFVDMEDLIVLGENWLWVACGSMENIPMSEIMMSMGKSMSFESMTLSQTASIPKPELTIKEQIEQAEENLNWLNNLWESEPEVRETIDEDRWEDFIERVEDWLDELEDSL